MRWSVACMPCCTCARDEARHAKHQSSQCFYIYRHGRRATAPHMCAPHLSAIKSVVASCREADQINIVRTYWWRTSRGAAKPQSHGQPDQPTGHGAEVSPGLRSGASETTAGQHTSAKPIVGRGAAPVAAARAASRAAASARPWSAAAMPAAGAARQQSSLRHTQKAPDRLPRARFAFLAALKAELRETRQRLHQEHVNAPALHNGPAIRTSWQKPVGADERHPDLEKSLLSAQPQRPAVSARTSPRRKPRSARRADAHCASGSPAKALASGAASAAQRPRPLLPGDTLSDAVQSLPEFRSLAPSVVMDRQQRGPPAQTGIGTPKKRLTDACHLAGRAGGWNSEALLRLARENPRLHAALLKTNAAADRMSTHSAPMQPHASVPASPAKITAMPPATAPKQMPASPGMQSASGPSARVSSGSQTELMTALRPAQQPSRHESAAQTQPHMDPTGGGCSSEQLGQTGSGETVGIEPSPGGRVVRVSLRVSQDASLGSPTRRSATMQVPYAVHKPNVTVSGLDLSFDTTHVRSVAICPGMVCCRSLCAQPAPPDPALDHYPAENSAGDCVPTLGTAWVPCAGRLHVSRWRRGPAGHAGHAAFRPLHCVRRAHRSWATPTFGNLGS